MLSPCFFIDLNIQKDFFNPKSDAYIKKAENILPNVKLLTKAASSHHLPLFSEHVLMEKHDFGFSNNPQVIKFLKSAKNTNCVLYGTALDFGLQRAAARLLAEGFQVFMPVDAVWCIHEENREKSLIELRKLGVHMWNTAFILANL
jgi:nicotinamidase-related amidase